MTKPEIRVEYELPYRHIRWNYGFLYGSETQDRFTKVTVLSSQTRHIGKMFGIERTLELLVRFSSISVIAKCESFSSR
jgi:hypothetical protein